MKTLCQTCLVGVLGFAGCASPPPSAALPPRPGNPPAAQVPARDKTLWQYRQAATAMRRAQFAEARTLLDDALLTLGGIYGRDKSARASRRLFNEEARKNFIGEPYERVMAYYYRGILYWMDGEPDNARACFRSAQIQDSDTENKTYAADYALLDYLDGFASVKLAGDGSDAFKRAQAESRLEQPPPYDARANVLFFVEYGHGPVKYATGQYREQLRFHEGPPGARAASIKVAGQTLRARPYDDLYFQATTRGGRVMDHVLANKAVFKAATASAGDAAIISGAILASQPRAHSSSDEIGAGLLAFGLLSKIVSSATTPAADTRAWDNLPQFLSFTAITLPPGQHTATAEFLDGAGRPLASKSATLEVVSGRDTAVFFSDQ